MATPEEIIDAAEKRAVFVKWVDSSVAANWHDVDKVAEGLRATSVVSVGYVLRDDDTEIVIAMSLDADTGNVGHILTIPHVAIVDIWEIDQ